ncbi:MAG: hypothetical protein ACI4U2_06460 [Christensenellaceae bacterium]
MVQGIVTLIGLYLLALGIAVVIEYVKIGYRFTHEKKTPPAPPPAPPEPPKEPPKPEVVYYIVEKKKRKRHMDIEEVRPLYEKK